MADNCSFSYLFRYDKIFIWSTQLERKTALGHLGHGFSLDYTWRDRPLWETKGPIVKIFPEPDFAMEIISVMSSWELMPITCSSPKEWRKQMEKICLKTAFEKTLWAARMRTYVPDGWGHLVILITFQNRSASVWASETVEFSTMFEPSSSCWEPCWKFQSSKLDPNFLWA